MNRLFALVLVHVLALGAMAACDQKKTETTATPAPSKPAAAQKYTCTMHPEVVQDEPGKCPKCGMELVPKTNS